MARSSAADRAFMTAALRLAQRGLGRTWPNPSVGCILIQTRADGKQIVVGRGFTQAGGRPHAETEALREAGPAAKGAIAYVTLEPCSHTGKTPPCAEALIKAGVSRVVAAMSDPDPRVSGSGLLMLQQAGIEIECGLCEEEAAALNRGFVSRVTEGRPMVTLKVATSLDGMIAAKGGASKWITGPLARAEAHVLRARHDAIMVGKGTVLADDPSLTCRLPGMEARSPVRIYCDARREVPLTQNLVTTAKDIPTWCLTGDVPDRAKVAGYAAAGVELIKSPALPDGRIDLPAALSALGKRGLTRILVEGGAALAGGLMRGGLVDELIWFRAPLVLGGDGLPALGSLGITDPANAPHFTLVERRRLGQDTMERYQVGR